MKVVTTNFWKLEESFLVALEAMDKTKEQSFAHFVRRLSLQSGSWVGVEYSQNLLQ